DRFSQRLAGTCIPHLGSACRAMNGVSGQQSCAVRVKCESENIRAWYFQKRADRLAALRIPHADLRLELGETGRQGERFAVRAERTSNWIAGLAVLGAALLGSADLPQARRQVPAARENRLAVRAEDRRLHLRWMRERRAEKLGGSRVP